MLISFLILFVKTLIQLLTWALFIHVILSWFARGRSQFGMWLDQIVQPLLRPFRWARIGPLDLSIIVVFFLLQWIGSALMQMLAQYAV